MIPVLKKGTTSDVENYRAISIVPIFGKNFEAILKTRLTSYIQRNSILSQDQYGFRSGRTTVQAVYEVVNRILMGLEEGIHVAISLCDLTKAFDCVCHLSLIKELYSCGIRGLPLMLLKSSLKSRVKQNAMCIQ